MNRIAIELNNAACDALNKGHYQIGTQILKEAVQTLHYATSPTKSDAIHQEEFEEKLKNSTRIVTRLDDIACPRIFMVDSYFIYSRAFKLKPDGPHSNDFHYTTFKLLYNIALAGHLQALSSGNSKQLKRAIIRYKFALESISNFSEDNEEIQRVLIAGLNNTGQLYHDFAEYDKAELCFAEVSRLLKPENQEFSEGIVLNLVMRRCSSTQLAPAA